MARAEALELILREDTLARVQRGKQEVIDEVQNMHERYPIDFSAYKEDYDSEKEHTLNSSNQLQAQDIARVLNEDIDWVSITVYACLLLLIPVVLLGCCALCMINSFRNWMVDYVSSQ